MNEFWATLLDDTIAAESLSPDVVNCHLICENKNMVVVQETLKWDKGGRDLTPSAQIYLFGRAI